MNPIIDNLNHQIAIKQTSQNLRYLKSTTNQIMKIPFMLNKDSQARIASLEAENARLKASVGGVIVVENSTGENVVAVTARGASGKVETRNMSLDDAARHSRKVVAGFTSRPSKPSKAPTASAPATPPAPLPASKEVDFEPTPQLAPLSRSEFNAMSPHDRTRFAVAGGKLK